MTTLRAEFIPDTFGLKIITKELICEDKNCVAGAHEHGEKCVGKTEIYLQDLDVGALKKLLKRANTRYEHRRISYQSSWLVWK